MANPTTPDYEIAVLPPYQSSQVKSQFIYARFKDVAAEESFYSYLNPSAANTDNLDDAARKAVNTM